MMFKREDLVRFRGRLGIVQDVRKIDLSWTKYILYKIEFEFDEFEWVK